MPKSLNLYRFIKAPIIIVLLFGMYFIIESKNPDFYFSINGTGASGVGLLIVFMIGCIDIIFTLYNVFSNSFKELKKNV